MSSVLFYLGLLSLSFAEPSKTSDALGPVEVSKEFPTFGSYTLEGQYLSFKSLQKQNKVLVISYFATWCKPCKVGLPIIEKIVQDQVHSHKILDLSLNTLSISQDHLKSKSYDTPLEKEPLCSNKYDDRSIDYQPVLEIEI